MKGQFESAYQERRKIELKNKKEFLVQHNCCIHKSFVKEEFSLKYEDVRKLIWFEADVEGSNSSFKKETAIVEFEIFLSFLDADEDGLSLSHFFRFVAGIDRIPLTSLKKPIDIYITDDELLPRASSCGYIYL